MNTLCYDVFDHIMSYLDFNDATKFIYVSKHTYCLYNNNQLYVRNILLKKGFSKLGIIYKSCDIPAECKGDTLHCLFDYFKRVGIDQLHIGDLLVHPKMCKVVFEFIVKKLRLGRTRSDQLSISYEDVQNVIIHGSLQNVLILFDTFCVPASELTYIMLELCNQMQDEKIKKCLDHFFCKHYFGYLSDDKLFYLHFIVTEFIKLGRTELVEHFFKLKSKYKMTSPLVLSRLADSALSCGNIWALQKMYNEYIQDNIAIDETSILIFDPKSLYKACKLGFFDCLQYVVEIIIGRLINVDEYFYNMCIGIKEYKYHNRINYDLSFMKTYLNIENQGVLNTFVI